MKGIGAAFFEGGRVRWYRLLLLFALGLVSLLYLHNVTGWLKNDDEGTALYASWRFAEGQAPYRDLVTTMAPMLLAIGAGLVKIFGPSIFALRAVTALAVIGGGAIWYRGLRTVAGRVAALFGTVVLLLTPEIFHLGRIFRADSWMIALVAAALGSLLMTRKGRPAGMAVPGALLGVALLTKLLALMPFLGAVIFLAASALPAGADRRIRALRLVVFLATTLLVAGAGYAVTECVAPGAMDSILGSHGGAADGGPRGQILVRSLRAGFKFAMGNLVILFAIPFLGLALPRRGRVPPGFLFAALLLPAAAVFLLKGAVYPRYFAYVALAASGVLALGLDNLLGREKGAAGRALAVALVAIPMALALHQIRPIVLRSESDTLAVSRLIAARTGPGDVILTDYAELAFHARRRSIPEVGGISYGWATAGLMTGERIIRAMEREGVVLVGVHVAGGSEPPEHFAALRDWPAFAAYVRRHYRLDTTIDRAGQRLEIYVLDR